MDTNFLEKEKRNLTEFFNEAWKVFDYIQKDENIQNDTYIIQEELINKVTDLFKKLKTIPSKSEFVSIHDADHY